MKLYSFSILFLLIVILTVSVYTAGNFNFIKKIPAVISNIFNTEEAVKINKHLTLNPQKGIYTTVWISRSQKNIEKRIDLIDRTELNAIIVDVKDSGVYVDDYTKNLVNKLHEKNIYTIARLVVFQDNSQVENHPEWYFKKADGSLWQDNRGWYWMNPTNREVWEYNIEISKQAINAGFDELNFDYIRYPSFKKDDDVVFPPVLKNRIINDFASYLTSELKKYNSYITLSVDLFAYNMLKKDDLGIGQNFVELYDYFDYVSPMIYPSHYLPGNFGFENPAEHPYEVIRDAMITASGRLAAASSTPSKLRPWLQDFDLGATYDAAMVRKEIQAAEGILLANPELYAGWLLWDPNNRYQGYKN